jgi:Fe-S oxidoreductase/nitrate reductase gamma subunit
MTPHREMFWQIEHPWIFYLVAALATAIFVAGIVAIIQVWKKNAGNLVIPFSKTSLKIAVWDTILGRRLFQGHVAAGIMHLLIFWGFLVLFTGTVLLFVHDYLISFLTGTSYVLYSLVMELGGLMFISGLLWALIRRYIQRVPRLEWRLEDAVVPLWLLLVGLSGFTVEGLRLSSQQPAWAEWSFVGGWLGMLVSPEGAKNLYPTLWWGHALLSLGLIAIIPYTKLFHILAAPAAIYVQGVKSPKPLMPDMDEDIDEDMDEAVDGTGAFDLEDAIFFDACMRCGRCVEACPSAGAGEPFAPREFVQAMRRAVWQENSPWGDIRLLSKEAAINVDEKLWYCTTCRACLEVCPVYGAPFEAVLTQRTLAVEEGTHVPARMNQTLEKIFKYDNPWESSKSNRAAWADGMDVVNLTKRGVEADLCYFVGCTTSFDDTAKGIAQSFSRILQSAGVRFGILGKKEPCCGDIARRAGEAGLFMEQTEKCLDVFERYEITDVVTSSPHCFHTFRNEYADAAFTARHYTLVLREQIADGKLSFKKGAPTTVTYHDPCYLGRYNHIYDEPREIIRAIPGMNLVEMAHHRADSLCCGGGGGRMWQDIKAEVKMSEVRLREAQATGAQILITACPLCRIMLEDARKSLGLTETLQVMDINELVLQWLELGNGQKENER